MNTVLIDYRTIYKKDIHVMYNPNNPSQFYTTINFTRNNIDSIIGVYLNGIYYNNDSFAYANGIFEMNNLKLDYKDRLYIICIVDDKLKKEFIMQYPIKNYRYEHSTIILPDDNINITHGKYNILGIILNGVLYAFDEILVVDRGNIEFNSFPVDPEKDNLRLLISTER